MTIRNNNKILVDFINEFDVPVCMINEDNIIIYLNKNMKRLFGNILGESADIIYVDNLTDNRKENINTAKGHKQIYMGEALYTVRSYPVEDDDGKNYSVKIFVDITEQKRVEAQLKNNYNKFMKDTKFARGIQNSVLPIDDVYADMLDLRTEYLPADELGGDMFDIIVLNDEEILFYVADVSGHGIKAALLTIFLREVVKGMSFIARDESIDKLLDALLKNYSDLDIDAEMYFSIVLCKYNKKTQELNLANAGHNCFPLILRKSGRIEEIPLKGMPIAKIGLGNIYEEETVGIYSGDRIILYTDGIVEEYSEIMGSEFGVQGVRNVISANFELSGKDLCRTIIHEAEKYSKTRAKDDRSIMVVTVL